MFFFIVILTKRLIDLNFYESYFFFVSFRNTQLLVEKRTHDIPDDLTIPTRRPLSRIEDLIEKRKSNRGLTPTVTPITKRRSQS
jgi:hypothetical protein